jgi:hypothetical protein
VPGQDQQGGRQGPSSPQRCQMVPDEVLAITVSLCCSAHCALAPATCLLFLAQTGHTQPAQAATVTTSTPKSVRRVGHSIMMGSKPCRPTGLLPVASASPELSTSACLLCRRWEVPESPSPSDACCDAAAHASWWATSRTADRSRMVAMLLQQPTLRCHQYTDQCPGPTKSQRFSREDMRPGPPQQC